MILDGKALAQEYKQRLKEEIASRKNSRAPFLAVILVGDDDASKTYVNAKEKACANVGIESSCLHLKKETTAEELAKEINRLNEDESVDGILLQLPLPSHLQSSYFLNMIKAEKDVDGLSSENVGRLWQGKVGLRPCTPLGVVALLHKTGVNLVGKRALIIGRSKLVGKPLLKMLIDENMTVTLAHSHSENLKDLCLESDVIVAATGQAHLIKEDYVKEGSIVIDVGVSRIDGKIVGDVDYENVKDKCSYITPMPGGTGPMTIAMLLENTWWAYKEKEFASR